MSFFARTVEASPPHLKKQLVRKPWVQSRKNIFSYKVFLGGVVLTENTLLRRVVDIRGAINYIQAYEYSLQTSPLCACGFRIR
jgi:hypothetical protein